MKYCCTASIPLLHYGLCYISNISMGQKPPASPSKLQKENKTEKMLLQIIFYGVYKITNNENNVKIVRYHIELQKYISQLINEKIIQITSVFDKHGCTCVCWYIHPLAFKECNQIWYVQVGMQYTQQNILKHLRKHVQRC